MSIVIIKKLLQTQLNSSNAGGPALVFENMKYKPVANTEWQKVDFLFAQTENPTMGDGFKRENGILQILLNYPLHAGSGAADERAEFWRAVFKRGTNFAEGTLRVLIHQSPWADRMPIDESWYRVAVSIPFIVDVHGA